MKNIWKLGLSFLLLICSGCSQEQNGLIKTEDKACGTECETTIIDDNKNNLYNEFSLQDSVDFINDGETGILLYGFEECPWCIEAKPILEEIASGENTTINYINVRKKGTDERTTDNPVYIELLNLLNKAKKLPKDFKLYVPYAIFVKNGDIVGQHEGTVETHNAKERKMTEAEINELKEIYKGYIELIKSNS